ncbi:hypothetical protein IPG36_01495 [bacterium]|nr:MAG: hypothetical protein IPG36_01495 [bacterium]
MNAYLEKAGLLGTVAGPELLLSDIITQALARLQNRRTPMKLAANILTIDSLRQADPVIVSLGNHQGIIQSMLDYDYLLGRSIPSVKAIVAGGRRTTRFFFGHQEIALPMYPSVADLPPALRQSTNLVLNVGSGRRVVESTAAAWQSCQT